MKNVLAKVWHIIRWPLLALFLLYAALVAYRIPIVAQKNNSDKIVAYIHAQKITMADVMGESLPPAPDQAANDATLAGIDANKNGIRDDVELAIFKKYPNLPKIRAAELQYAKALQLELTQVTDSNTLVAAIQEEDRASLCITGTAPKVTLSDSDTKIKSALALSDARKKEVEILIFNTDQRKQKQQSIYQKYMTSYSDPNVAGCDIDPSSS